MSELQGTSGIPAIDFHVHCRRERLCPSGEQKFPGPFRGWLAGFITLDAFMMVGYARVLPGFIYSLLAPATWTAIERRLAVSDTQALARTWNFAGVRGGVICPVEPHLHNSDVTQALEQLSATGQENSFSLGLVRAVDPDPMTPDSLERLEEGRRQGAGFLKLHPLSGGYPADSPQILKLVKRAHDLGMGVQIHTGGYAGMFGKTASDGGVDAYVSLAGQCDDGPLHMVHTNLFDPLPLLSRLLEAQHVTFGLSFKDRGTIRRMADMAGTERLLFESDWPLGDPLASRHQIEMALDGDTVAIQRVLRDNALSIFEKISRKD